MLIKSQGIVIKTTRYSDSSVIARLYTDTHGMLDFLIQGVYSRKASFKPSLLQSIQLLEMEYYFRENQNLLKIKEARSLYTHNTIHFDVRKSAIAMVMAELIYKCVKEEEKNEALFGFLKNEIEILDRETASLSSFLLVFMIHFTRYLGFFPSNQFSEENPYFNLYEGIFCGTNYLTDAVLEKKESKILDELLRSQPGGHGKIKLEKPDRLRLLDILTDYISMHIQGFRQLKSLSVIKEVFS